MSTERCLFVGGPYDGRWIEVNEGALQVSLPVTRESGAVVPAAVTTPSASDKQVLYAPQVWTTFRSKRYRVFAHGLTPDRVFERLLQCYTPQGPG